MQGWSAEHHHRRALKQVVEGLLNRRRREVALFFGGMRKIAVALVALLVLVAGCEGLQKASNRATCAVAAQTCITLYSGGATLAAYKDPSSMQPTPMGCSSSTLRATTYSGAGIT